MLTNLLISSFSVFTILLLSSLTSITSWISLFLSSSASFTLLNLNTCLTIIFVLHRPFYNRLIFIYCLDPERDWFFWHKRRSVVFHGKKTDPQINAHHDIKAARPGNELVFSSKKKKKKENIITFESYIDAHLSQPQAAIWLSVVLTLLSRWPCLLLARLSI